MQKLATIFTDEDDPYVGIDLAELINKADEQASSLGHPKAFTNPSIESGDILKHRVQELKVMQCHTHDCIMHLIEMFKLYLSFIHNNNNY